MRETIGIPAGALVYPLSIIFLLLAVKILVPAPQEWSGFDVFGFTCVLDAG